jgi:sugar lactone lactonase YvrE
MKKSGIALILILIMSGCATAPPQQLFKVFYPSPPDLPRVQYLTSFVGEKDFGRKKSFFESFITGSGEKYRRLDKPYGVAAWGGKIYVCDTNQGVLVFDLEKRTLNDLAGAQGLGKLQQPINISVDAEGNKFVADPVRGQVVVFDRNDFYVTSFGSPDTWRPVDAVPYGNEIYVADMKDYQIVVLDKKSGNVLRQIGGEGSGEARLGRPTNLAFNKEGYLFVSDLGRFQIVKFDRDGHFLGTIGEIGVESGTFARPKGIAVDRDDRLYVVDAAFANVQIFDKDGDLLMALSKGGRLPGELSLPSQVTVDYGLVKYFQQYADPNFEVDGILIVISQFGSRMVNVYGLGKERGKVYPTDAELVVQMKAKLAERIAKEKAEKEKIEKEKAGKEKTDKEQTTETKGGADKEGQ